MYTNESNILMLISLLKKHGVRKIVASPGNTNIPFVASVQDDKDFEVYSCIDERSAAYIATGMAEESGEPVAITCTGATASRNYVSALTEAYYRKIPIIAITATQQIGRIGQLIPQVIDRSQMMCDIVKKSVTINPIQSEEDRWNNEILINTALLETKRNGGGPVHINLVTVYDRAFSTAILPETRKIDRLCIGDDMPAIKANTVCVFVGSHRKWSDTLTGKVEEFCRKYNAVILCDHTSNYNGQFKMLGGLVERQHAYYSSCKRMDLLIHIGEVSGAYYTFMPNEVWRVSPDGEIRDTFRRLTNVFQMEEEQFFEEYNAKGKETVNTYYKAWEEENARLYAALRELPFSNAWVAQNTMKVLPEGSVLHFGILNSLRMWNLFPAVKRIHYSCNVGGFGIDGTVSSLVGSSLASPNKIHFGVFGELSVFYDLNIFGNRHLGNNLRIVVINNGCGFEMRHNESLGYLFGEEANRFFAAKGHFNNSDFIRHVVEDLGFEYFRCIDKEEYLKILPYFASEGQHDKPMLVEVIVEDKNELRSFDMISNTCIDLGERGKQLAKKILGEDGKKIVKKIIKRS